MASVVHPGLAGARTVLVDDPAPTVTGGVQPVGPQTFAVDSGRIYVHDQAHAALRIYTLAGVFVRSVRLPQGLAVLDLAVRGSAVKLLDLDGGVHTMRLTATSAVETGYSSAGEIGGVGVSRIGWFGDQLVGQVAAEGQRVLSKGAFLGKPVGAVIGTVKTSMAGRTVGLTSAGAGTTQLVTVPNTPVDGYEAFREQGFSYDVVTDERSDGEVWLEDSWVFRYDASGALVASYSLGAQSWYTPSREVAVSDGHVYQLLIGATHAQVVELSPDRPGTLSSASVTPAQVAAPLKAAGVPGRHAKAVLARARSMAKVNWTYKVSAHGQKFRLVSSSKHGKKVTRTFWVVPSKESDRVVLAPQLAAINTKYGCGPDTCKAKCKKQKCQKKMTAYPYAWGGYDTDVTHSDGASWKNFANALAANNVFVSNVRGPRGTSWVQNTAGVDCSGFISSVFGMGVKRGTGNLVDGKYFKKLSSLSKALPGDILNRAGHHVRLVVGLTGGSKLGVTGFVVAESTTTVTNGGVQINRYSLDQLTHDHYVAAKYTHWLADPPPSCIASRVCYLAEGSGVAR